MTPESVVGQQLARELAAAMDLPGGGEVALVGSVARGWADADSDIELVVWSERIPEERERLAMLERAGAEPASLVPITSRDGTVWTWWTFGGRHVEVGWQELGRHEENLRAVLAGETLEHEMLVVAHAVTTAVPLRTAGALERWQAGLASYPDVLRERLILRAARRWTYPVAFWGLARRDDRVGALERSLADVVSILRTVFALNRAWEPPWKWINHSLAALDRLPADFAERLNALLAEPDITARLEATARLAFDTLSLVAEEFDVGEALAALERSQERRSP